MLNKYFSHNHSSKHSFLHNFVFTNLTFSHNKWNKTLVCRKLTRFKATNRGCLTSHRNFRMLIYFTEKKVKIFNLLPTKSEVIVWWVSASAPAERQRKSAPFFTCCIIYYCRYHIYVNLKKEITFSYIFLFLSWENHQDGILNTYQILDNKIRYNT